MSDELEDKKEAKAIKKTSESDTEKVTKKPAKKAVKTSTTKEPTKKIEKKSTKVKISAVGSSAEAKTVKKEFSSSAIKNEKEVVKSAKTVVVKQGATWDACAVGKRKSSSARVFITKEKNGQVLVNNREFEDFFGPRISYKAKLLKPFEVCDFDIKEFKIKIDVSGGGTTGAIDSILLGISRCLLKIASPEEVLLLKKAGLLTRDSRVVESKKYGLRKARKREQFSKR